MSYNNLDNDDPFSIDDDVVVPDASASNDMTDITINSASQPTGNMSFSSTTASGRPKKQFDGGYFSINYYRRYFDLDTPEFFANCLRSLNPLYKMDSSEFEEVGDLYGAVWITATVILVLFFSNSFAQLLTDWFLGQGQDEAEKKMQINYLKMLLSSINLLYGYIVLLPLVLWAVFKWYFQFGRLVSLTKLVSIYAYSNLMWLPAAFLGVFRGFLVHHKVLDIALMWSCIFIGGALSGVSILSKLAQYLRDVADDKNRLMVLGAVTVLHLGFSVGVKVCFFGKI